MEAEVKSGTLDWELIFLIYGLICFLKLSGKVWACAGCKRGRTEESKKRLYIFRETKHIYNYESRQSHLVYPFPTTGRIG
jgi:hypothetical protein